MNTILNYFVSGAGRNASYAALATFTDRFGPRLSGTPALENAIGVYRTLQLRLLFHRSILFRRRSQIIFIRGFFWEHRLCHLWNQLCRRPGEVRARQSIHLLFCNITYIVNTVQCVSHFPHVTPDCCSTACVGASLAESTRAAAPAAAAPRAPCAARHWRLRQHAAGRHRRRGSGGPLVRRTSR